MNHGIVCIRGETVTSKLWEMAMGRSQYVALYTTRFIGGGHAWYDSGVSGPSWNSAFMHSIGEPAVFDPRGFGQRPGFRHPTGEYARYEPAYDLQFRKMVEVSHERKFLSIA